MKVSLKTCGERDTRLSKNYFALIFEGEHIKKKESDMWIKSRYVNHNLNNL